jgi:hypothetical protein
MTKFAIQIPLKYKEHSKIKRPNSNRKMVKEYKQFSEMEIKMYVRKVCTTSLIIKEEQLKTESSIIFLLSQIKNFDSIHFGDFESEGEGKQAQCS